MTNNCESCNLTAIFNMPGSEKAKTCNNHILPGMIDVKTIRCMHDGCTVRARFISNEGSFCVYHRNSKTVNP